METYRELRNTHMVKIDGLARHLLPVLEPKSAADIFNLQIELLQYHIELQRAIGDEQQLKREMNRQRRAIISKELSDTNRTALNDLQRRLDDSERRLAVYKHVQRLARCIGDAVARYLLGSDLQYLLAHAENAPSRTVPHGHGLEGMLAVSGLLLESGYGFPVFHDITNWLRIGDVTFVNPAQDPIRPVCAEVKTRAMSVDGGIRYQIETVGFLSAESEPIHIGSGTGAPKEVRRLIERVSDPAVSEEQLPRHGRQLRRMINARLMQDAPPNTMLSVNGQELIVGESQRDDDSYHREEVRRLVELARKHGYASAVVDGAFLYVATYTEEPAWYPWQPKILLPHHERLAADSRASGIWFSDPSQNRLYYSGTWEFVTSQVPPNIEPFLLYWFLPPDAVMDMLHGRLFVGVFANLGRLVEALAIEGIDARMPADDAEFNELLIPIEIVAPIPGGGEWVSTIATLSLLGAELLFAFLSLPAFVREIKQMVVQGAARARNKAEALAG